MFFYLYMYKLDKSLGNISSLNDVSFYPKYQLHLKRIT